MSIFLGKKPFQRWKTNQPHHAWSVLWFGFVTPAVLIAHQCFDCSWTFSFISHSAPTSPQWLGKKLGGGDTAGRADLNWAKGYSVPYSIMQYGSSKNWGKGKRGRGVSSKVVVAQSIAGHRSACGRWRLTGFASLGFVVLFFSFLHLLNWLSLDPQVFLLLLFLFSAPLSWLRNSVVGEWAAWVGA